ncbi:MAG: dihydroneopterin aldolase [Bacteroidetes bacterium]|nr:dihydroneopterin aldolase [Bacteroidota bacterium]
MDKLIINEAKYQCFAGTQPEEIISKQEILIYLEIFFDIQKSAETDDISDTIDYRDINKRLKSILQKQHNLIETISEKIAKDFIKKYEIQEILVRVSKPSSLKNVKNFSVEIRRFNSNSNNQKLKGEISNVKIHELQSLF